MLNVKPSEKRGGGGRHPPPWREFDVFFKAGCGSVNGHGWCLSCFLWQIIHGTIREWHLSGSKLFVFVSMWHSFSALKFIWYQFVFFIVGITWSTVYIPQMSGPPQSWMQTDSLFWAQDFSVTDLYRLALSIQSQQLQLSHLGQRHHSGLEKWKNTQDKYVLVSIKLKENHLHLYSFNKSIAIFMQKHPHTGRKSMKPYTRDFETLYYCCSYSSLLTITQET